MRGDAIEITKGYYIGQDQFNVILYKPRKSKEGSTTQLYNRSYHPSLRSLVRSLAEEEVKNNMLDSSYVLDEEVPSLKNLENFIEDLVSSLEEEYKDIIKR